MRTYEQGFRAGYDEGMREMKKNGKVKKAPDIETKDAYAEGYKDGWNDARREMGQ